MSYFRIGDRVEMTDEGIKKGLGGRNMRIKGVVTKITKTATQTFIRVRRDGEKIASEWSDKFWKKELKEGE